LRFNSYDGTVATAQAKTLAQNAGQWSSPLVMPRTTTLITTQMAEITV
jgi:hypothetical protein